VSVARKGAIVVLTFITNGKIYTFNQKEEIVQSIVVDGEKIIDLGTDRDMKLQYGSQIKNIIDLQGKTAIPGLTDSHMHLSGVASNFIELNLTGVKSKQEMLNQIKEKASTLPEGEWLLGRGWDENLFEEGSIPTIAELDEAAKDHPLFLGRICGHAFLANKKAFEVCQVSPLHVPAGGEIVLDPITKEPTGLILETASELFTKHIPDKSYEQWKAALNKAMEYCMKCGLTSIHTNDPLYLGGFDQTYQLYDELIHQEKIGLRCHLLIDYPFLSLLNEKNRLPGYGNSRLNIGAIKIFADGALGRRTALLSEPYEDDPSNYGTAIHDEKKLFEMIQKAREYNAPVAVHTIGDKALENVLNILEQLPEVSMRDRVIHASILRPDLIQRMKKTTLIADIQPRFIPSDFPWIEERIGKKRTEFAYPFKTMLQNGILCAGGSDAPIEPVEPLLGIHAAVTRKRKEEHHDGYIPHEKISIKEAIQLYTIGGAYASNEENVKGTIEKGKYADLTVLSHDLLQLKDPDEILDTSVEMTIIGGKQTYTKYE